MLLHPIACGHAHRAPLPAEQRALSFYILIRRLLCLGIHHPHTADHGFAALIVFHMVPIVYQYDLDIGKAGKIGQLVGQAVACMVDGQPFFVFFGAQDIIPIDKPDFPHGRYPLRWRSTS